MTTKHYQNGGESWKSRGSFSLSLNFVRRFADFVNRIMERKYERRMLLVKTQPSTRSAILPRSLFFLFSWRDCDALSFREAGCFAVDVWSALHLQPSGFEIDEKGLAVIQQRFDPKTKSTSWTEVDAYLTDVLYLHPKFKEFFDSRARTCTDGLYPTVTIRQIMWALKMKPLPKQTWETVFDRSPI